MYPFVFPTKTRTSARHWTNPVKMCVRDLQQDCASLFKQIKTEVPLKTPGVQTFAPCSFPFFGGARAQPACSIAVIFNQSHWVKWMDTLMGWRCLISRLLRRNAHLSIWVRSEWVSQTVAGWQEGAARPTSLSVLDPGHGTIEPNWSGWAQLGGGPL